MAADASSWEQNFEAVKDLLTQNKILIREINSNHDTRTPEALARNVVLIRELNSNLSKVLEQYKTFEADVPQTLPGVVEQAPVSAQG